jgi:hypothetical protein
MGCERCEAHSRVYTSKLLGNKFHAPAPPRKNFREPLHATRRRPLFPLPTPPER